MDTSERLIESTQRLLWERGYAGTSPSAIQVMAGAGQGSMYYHFDSKAALALAAVTRSAGHLRAEAEQALSTPGSAERRLSRYLQLEREVLRGCPIGRLTADHEVAGSVLEAPVRETFDWLVDRIAEIIAEGQRARELVATLNPVETASTIAAVVQGGYVLARAAGTVEPFDRAIRGVEELMLGYVMRRRS